MNHIARAAEGLFRPLRRDPGFAVAVLVILGFGIAANTATVNLIYGYLLAPLPYPHAGRLVNVYFTSEQTPGNQGMSYPTYFDLRAQTTAMAAAGMYQPESLNLIEGARAVHANGADVSASLFTTLGVRPLIGRVFGPASNQLGAASLAGLHFIRRQDLGQALRDADARSAGGRGEHHVRAGLAITQIALAAALIGAGAMLARSLANLDAVRLGFQPQHVLTFQVHIPFTAAGKAPPDLVTRLSALHRALVQVPGVTAATVTSDVPFDGQPAGNAAYPYPYDRRHNPILDSVVADPNYFRSFDIPLLAGRAFAPQDAVSQEGSAEVDRQAARALFGTPNVLGRELTFNSPNASTPGLRYRIVGIVANTRYAHLASGEQMGVVYLDRQALHQGSAWFWAAPTWYVAIRTPLDSAAILPALRQAVSRALPGVPVYDVRSMNERLAGELAPRRGMTALVLMFALGALAVVAVGLYAVQSYAVSQRRPELGVRAALGADGSRLRALVLREVLVLLAIGLAVGLCGVVALGRVLSSRLYGVRAADPVSLILVLVVLSATALLAGWIPARRASRVPPMAALRDR